MGDQPKEDNKPKSQTSTSQTSVIKVEAKRKSPPRTESIQNQSRQVSQGRRESQSRKESQSRRGSHGRRESQSRKESQSRRGSHARRGSQNLRGSHSDSRSLNSTGSAKKDSLLNIFNNRNTKELKNLRDEARIMNFKSENLSNEELECKYKLFCLPERSSSSVENMIDRNTLSLKEAIEKKIKALKLVHQLERDLQHIKERTKKCEKNLRGLKNLLDEL